jgi:hypothetical protein
MSSLTQALTSFPLNGLNSINGYTSPINSGTVNITEIRNILDTRWATSAMTNAATLVSSNSTIRTISSNCLTSNGITNSTASLFGLSNNGAFDIAGLSSLLGAGAGSLLTLISDLQIAATLQSLVAGLAKLISSTASGVFLLLDKMLTNGDSSMLSMASGLVASMGRAVDLFANAFKSTLSGDIGMGGINPGDLISGTVTMIGGLVGGTVVGAAVLVGGAALLAASLASMGISALISPTSSFSSLSGLMSSISGTGSSGLLGFGSAMSNLNAETLAKVSSKIGSSLSSLFPSNDFTGSMINSSGNTNTFDRSQGLGILDGDNWNSSSLTRIAGLGLAFLLWQLAKKSGNKALSGSATAILLATLLGNAAPIASSFLGASNGSWLGSAAAALSGISGVLADTCAYNTALNSALGQVGNATTAQLDALLSSLECRRSSYDNLYNSALSSALGSQDLLSKLLSLLGIVNGVSYPTVCPDSGYKLGSCS